MIKIELFNAYQGPFIAVYNKPFRLCFKITPEIAETIHAALEREEQLFEKLRAAKPDMYRRIKTRRLSNSPLSMQIETEVDAIAAKYVLYCNTISEAHSWILTDVIDFMNYSASNH